MHNVGGICCGWVGTNARFGKKNGRQIGEEFIDCQLTVSDDFDSVTQQGLGMEEGRYSPQTPLDIQCGFTLY